METVHDKLSSSHTCTKIMVVQPKGHVGHPLPLKGYLANERLRTPDLNICQGQVE